MSASLYVCFALLCCSKCLHGWVLVLVQPILRQLLLALGLPVQLSGLEPTWLIARRATTTIT